MGIFTVKSMLRPANSALNPSKNRDGFAAAAAVGESNVDVDVEGPPLPPPPPIGESPRLLLCPTALPAAAAVVAAAAAGPFPSTTRLPTAPAAAHTSATVPPPLANGYLGLDDGGVPPSTFAPSPATAAAAVVDSVCRTRSVIVEGTSACVD